MGSLLILIVTLAAIAAAPLGSRAARSATTITIVNSSSKEIRHVYLSPTNQELWGPDQLNNSTIYSGSSQTLSNIACEGSDIKVITEDQDGCFLYRVVICNESTTWTITNDVVPDCGN